MNRDWLERKGRVAVRIFEAFPQKNEERGVICGFDPEQRPEDDVEAVRFSDTGGADEPDLFSHALYYGAVFEGRALYDG